MEPEDLDLADDTTAAAVHAVALRAYRIEADLIGFDEIPPLRETLAEMRTQPLRWLGIRADGGPVAFLAWSSDPVVDIERVCVDPEWHRRGLARKLVSALLDRTSGDVVVSTGAANAPAVALYERAGFVRTDTIEPVPGLKLATFLLQRG